jgi:hypothetical protein
MWLKQKVHFVRRINEMIKLSHKVFGSFEASKVGAEPEKGSVSLRLHGNGMAVPIL